MALINVLKSTDFVNTAYRPVKNRHFSANIVLCAENVSENEKSGKAEYSYFVPALWHLLLSPPPTPIAHLVLSAADLAFFVPHPVRIFRRSSIDAPRRGRRPRRPVAFLFPHASGEGYSAPRARATFGRSGPTTFFSMPPAAIFLSTAKEIWKRTPPKTNGFWISLVRFQPRYKKVPHRIACNPIPAAAPTHRAETRRSVIVQRDCCVHIGGFPNTGVPR